MAIRLETKPSMLRRCRGWDYRQPCIYMITLVLADRRSQALGRLVIPGASAPGSSEPRWIYPTIKTTTRKLP